MSTQDTVADMITRIRNAQRSKLLDVRVKKTRLNISILEVLKTEGYIYGYVNSESDNIYLEVHLKYKNNGSPVVEIIDRVSKSSKRVYSSCKSLTPYRGFGIHVISTPKGVMSDRRARELGVGGEVMFRVF
jgi:small subunit ribosomal protein S8